MHHDVKSRQLVRLDKAYIGQEHFVLRLQLTDEVFTIAVTHIDYIL